jgi:C4-dicarboxylate transporter DctM subunit
MGGIYLGAFTPTEAAAVSAAYAAFVAIVVYREVRIEQVVPVLVDSAKLISMLMFIIANAYLFAFVLTTEQIPQAAAAEIVELGMPPWLFLAVLNVVLLIAGNFMDPTSVILIVAPIVFPVAQQLGVDPVHLGIVMTVNMEIGLVTPPVGLNLFVTANVAELPIERVVVAIMPWLGALLAVLLLVTYVPALSLALPNLVAGMSR